MATKVKRGRPKLRVVQNDNEPKRRGGRRKWEPTPLERRTVERCMAIGFTIEQAAAVLGKSVDSLERHCRAELDTGAAKVGAKVGGQLLRKALAGDTQALIFYAKSRLGWNEKQILEHQGRGGGPIVHSTIQADADAFTARVMALAQRHAIETSATINVTPLPLPAPPSPNEIN
jgi:hypothetical protein